MQPIPKKGMQTTPGYAGKDQRNILPWPGPCEGCAPHPQMGSSAVSTEVVNLATFTHSKQTRANQVKFAHQLLCNPKISTLLKAVRRGFLTGCPNLTKRLILKYLNPSTAMAKGHMKQPRHGVRSTGPRCQNRRDIITVPAIRYPVQEEPNQEPVRYIIEHPQPIQQAMNLLNLIGDDGDESIANMFCFGAFADKNSGIVYHDLTGNFPFMSSNGSVCFFILYHYESNTILGTPIAGLDDVSIFNT
jgi:hypothetical protein